MLHLIDIFLWRPSGRKTTAQRPCQKQLPRPAEHSQLRCLMVFDTQAKQFVGSGCYVVTGKPSTGDVAKFETVSAEFVGLADVIRDDFTR
jgi:hypothetical protein